MFTTNANAFLAYEHKLTNTHLRHFAYGLLTKYVFELCSMLLRGFPHNIITHRRKKLCANANKVPISITFPVFPLSTRAPHSRERTCTMYPADDMM